MKYLLEQEEKIEVKRLENDFQDRMFINAPERWQEMYGAENGMPTEDDAIYQPDSKESLNAMLDEWEREGWTPVE